MESLRQFGADHYVRARETGHVLYLEGSTDLVILRAFADRLLHPVRDLLADDSHLNVYSIQGIRSMAQSALEVLDGVEGAFGKRAKEHFEDLRAILPQYRLIERQDAGEIDPEVSVKLDAIQRLLQPASSDSRA